MIGLLINQIKSSTQLRWNKVHKFKAKVNLRMEIGPYVIKTAETRIELIESFRLRDEVFNQEFRGMKDPALDFDRFDYYFDHLIIVHRDSNKIIGTYRLNCSSFSKESYTGTEFDLAPLFLHQGPFLELGRACIHKDYRKGSIISLLWRGITEYMNLCEANILFGCSSVKVINVRDTALIYKHLSDTGHVSNEFFCGPTKKYQMHDFKAWHTYFQKGLTAAQSEEAENLIPSLLKSYLKLGAKVACEPAFDEEFCCIDLLTVLKKENLADSLVKKFQAAR